MTDFSKLLEIKKQNANQKVADDKHQQILDGQLLITNNIVDATMALIKYLEGHTSLVKVQNQIEKVGTPDVFNVVTSLQALHNTIKTHKNTDLTEITSVMKQVLQEVQNIPKSEVEIPEHEVIDYKPDLRDLGKAIKAVEKVIKEQKLVAEAPIVNVPETQVNVEAPDLVPLQKSMADVVTAVTKIVIPEYKTDNKKVEELIKKTNKLLAELLDKPVASGGGGGGRVSPYENSEGIPMFVVLESDGSLPVTIKGSSADYSMIQYDDTSDPTNYEYYAYMNGSSSWYIKRLNVDTNLFEFTIPVTTTYATGWTGRAGLTYVSKGAAF